MKKIYFLKNIDLIIRVEVVPDHNYSRPWTDDPTIATALPRVQLFVSGNST